MAKNFGNAGSMKAVANAKKVEQEKAQVVALQQDLIHNVKPQRVGWRQRARKGTT